MVSVCQVLNEDSVGGNKCRYFKELESAETRLFV